MERYEIMSKVEGIDLISVFGALGFRKELKKGIQKHIWNTRKRKNELNTKISEIEEEIKSLKKSLLELSLVNYSEKELYEEIEKTERYIEFLRDEIKRIMNFDIISYYEDLNSICEAFYGKLYKPILYKNYETKYHRSFSIGAFKS